MKVIVYKSDSQGVTAIGNASPLPVTSGYDSALSFNQTVDTVNATAGVQVKGATSGKSIYIKDMIISSEQASDIRLEDSDGTVLIPYMHFAANQCIPFSFNTPLKVTASKALNLRSVAATHITAYFGGEVF